MQLRQCLLQMLKREFSVEVAVLSQLSQQPLGVCHLLLSQYAEEVEIIDSHQISNTGLDVTVQTGEPVRVVSLSTDTTHFSCKMMDAEKLEALLTAPIFRNGYCIGALQIMNKAPRFWTKSEEAELCKFARLAEEITPGTNTSIVDITQAAKTG